MSNIKVLCKQYRDNPKECLKQLKALNPTQSVVGQWAFYAALIGYHEVFRACWKSVDEALRVRRSDEHTKTGLMMNACVGGHPQIVECVARAYAKDINDAYKMVEHCVKSGKKEVLDVLLRVGEEVNVYGWNSAHAIQECFKTHQNTMAREYLNTYKNATTPPGSFANNCCIMGNIEGLVLLHDFCKANPEFEWKYTWRQAIEEASKNQRIQMMDFLLDEGLKLFTQEKNTETYFLGVANAAYWGRSFMSYANNKSEDMFEVVFKNAPFETWKHKVSGPSLDFMEQRYATYLRNKIQSNIDAPDTTASNRRKI